jgi:Rieske Fe-S protein
MSESDKYPESSGRRRFVKGVVGAASLTALGAVTIGSVQVATSTGGGGGGPTQFFGIENTAGPAPRAMPQIPIEIDDEGFIRGVYPEVREVERQGQTVTVTEEEIGGATYSAAWFQYCGVQNYEGVSPQYDGDNYFRYSGNSDYDWQSESASEGDRINIDDLADYEEWGNNIGTPGLGKPAQVTWRSEGTEETIPVQVLRTSRLQEVIDQTDGPAAEWLEASTQNDTIAWLNKCTHFCCTPGFKTTTQAAEFNAENQVYCPCHQSVYDPYSIVTKRFVAFPRPED